MKEETTYTTRYLRHAVVLLVAGLLAAALLISATAISTATARETSASSAVQTRTIHIPKKAYEVAMFAYKHNWSPPRGIRGNKHYENSNHKLPNGHGHYKRYYVYPASTGSRKRIVINTQTKGWFYSPDHYEHFRYVGELDNK